MNAFSMPGAESTSATLRRVEQERDDAVRRAADLEQVREELTQMRIRAESEGELSRSLIGEKQELIHGKLALKAELASAHQELDALRTVRDRLDAALDHTRQQLGDAVNELMDWGVFGIPGASNPPEGAPPA